MITLFSAPKGFTHSPTAVIQRNAIRSWKEIHPDIDIILMGDDPGVAEVAREFDVRHLPKVQRNASGTPRVDDIFRQGEAAARHSLLTYVNADIILLPDFIAAIRRLELSRFLLVGRRTDLDVSELLSWGPGAAERLRARAASAGRLHGHAGIDYFGFSRGLWPSIPPFGLGRTSWDNWLLYRAHANGHPVIDATAAITAIHQNHDYGHHAQGWKGVWKGPEARANLRLAGGAGRLFTLRDADLMMNAEGVLESPPLSPYRIASGSFRRFARPGPGRLFAFPGWLALVIFRRLMRILS